MALLGEGDLGEAVGLRMLENPWMFPVKLQQDLKHPVISVCVQKTRG